MLAHLTYSGPCRIVSAIRAQNAARRRRDEAERLAAFQLVIETVHPDNLGPLPPSPRKLADKAYLLGLGVFSG